MGENPTEKGENHGKNQNSRLPQGENRLFIWLQFFSVIAKRSNPLLYLSDVSYTKSVSLSLTVVLVFGCNGVESTS